MVEKMMETSGTMISTRFNRLSKPFVAIVFQVENTQGNGQQKQRIDHDNFISENIYDYIFNDFFHAVYDFNMTDAMAFDNFVFTGIFLGDSFNVL